MRILSFFKTNVWVAVLIALIFIAFKDFPGTFFQQDELWSFGRYNRVEGINGLVNFVKNVVLTPGNVRYNPLTDLAFFLQYKLFQMNFSLYAFASIFIHILNTFLVCFFVNKIFKNKYLAVLSALLFAVNSASHQAVTWVASSLNTQGSTLFSLLFYILFLHYLENKMKNKKILVLSLFFLIIGPLFKENIAPFLLAPLLYLFYRSDKSFIFAKKVFIPFGFFILFYLLLHIFIYFSAPIVPSENVELLQTGITEYSIRILLLPFRIIAQSLVHAKYLLAISQDMMRFTYPQLGYPDGSVNPLLRETLGYDIIGLIISVVIIIAAFFSYRFFKNRNKHLSKGIILFLLITIFSDIAIAFIPGSLGYASLISSRYLYPGSFGAAGLLILILFAFSSWINEGKSKIILALPFFIIILWNTWTIRADISELKKISDIRTYMITSVLHAYPYLPKQVLVYTQSDKSYYGMPDDQKTLPFQVGFGLILLVSYHGNENFPPCMYDAKLVLDMRSQGYKECEGRGFGYFRDYDKLVKAIKSNKISINNVISYSWNGEAGGFRDITKIIRDKLIIENIKK